MTTKIEQRSYEEALTWLRDHGFDLIEAPGTQGRVFLRKYKVSAAIQKNGDVRLDTVGTPLPVAVAPMNSSHFSNGVWTGNLSVSVPATNVVVLADDGDGHYGSANPFSVLLHDDIGLTVTASPEPVGLGENLTYTIVVTNIGPSAATGVTSNLEDMATFVSAQFRYNARTSSFPSISIFTPSARMV